MKVILWNRVEKLLERHVIAHNFVSASTVAGRLSNDKSSSEGGKNAQKDNVAQGRHIGLSRGCGS